LQDVGSQLTSKSSKRKREGKYQSNNHTSYKNKGPNEKGFRVTVAEDEEKLREYVVVGLIGYLLENLGSLAEVDTITVLMSYMEYVDQNICSPYNTRVIKGNEI